MNNAINKIISEDVQTLRRPVVKGMRAQMNNYGRIVRRDEIMNAYNVVVTPIIDEPPIVNRFIPYYRDQQLFREVEIHEMENIGDNAQNRQVTSKSSYVWCKELGRKLKKFLKETSVLLMLFLLTFSCVYILILICDRYAPKHPKRYTMPNIFLKLYNIFLN